MNWRLLRTPAARACILYGLIDGAVSLILTVAFIAKGANAAPGPLRSANGFISFGTLVLIIYSVLI
jgi:hypothetical protein